MNSYNPRRDRMSQFRQTDWLTIAAITAGAIALLTVMYFIGAVGDAVIGLLELK